MNEVEDMADHRRNSRTTIASDRQPRRTQNDPLDFSARPLRLPFHCSHLTPGTNQLLGTQLRKRRRNGIVDDEPEQHCRPSEQRTVDYHIAGIERSKGAARLSIYRFTLRSL
ncbi:MAG: hypothetical protein ABL921_28885 [Pirellula sp.]